MIIPTIMLASTIWSTISIIETGQLNPIYQNVLPNPAKRYFSDHISDDRKMVYPRWLIFPRNFTGVPMYVYQMSFPIDCFGVMRQVKDVYDSALKHEAKCHDACDSCYECALSSQELRYLLRRALRALARMQTYWEGDVRGSGDLCIGSVPGDDDYNQSQYFIALKQDNNGSSFLVSQVEFSHLQENLIIESLNCPVKQDIQDRIKGILDIYTPCAEANDCEVF